MNRILLLLTSLLLILSLNLNAQQTDCAFKLQEAEDLYETGILDSIPSLLRNCINNDGFDDEELSRAYKLLILTYLFEDYQEMAELTMLKFLKKFPEYEFKATDPVEFRYLYNSYQTIPTFSFGIMIGGNYTMPRLIEPYSVGNTDDYSGEYTSGFYFQGGLQFKKYITDEIEIDLDLLYTAKTFTYSISQFENTTNYSENLQMLSAPLSGTYGFNFGNLKPYVRLGFNVDYLFSAKADFDLEYANPGLEPVNDSDVDILDDRVPLNISALVGGGVKINLKVGYAIADIRYHYNFTNIVNGDNRNNGFKQDLYFYVDDDFTINNFYFSIGYVYPFYKTKQNNK